MGKLQERTNNPLNVRYSPANNWLGQTGQYKGFCVFKDEFWGIRAALKVIIAYMKRGIKTIEGIVETYAPRNENKTDMYVDYVSRYMGFSPRYELKDWIDILHLLQAMWRMESGTKPHSLIIGRVIGWLSCELESVGIYTSAFLANELNFTEK